MAKKEVNQAKKELKQAKRSARTKKATEEYTKIGRFLPRSWDEKVAQLFIYADVTGSADLWIGVRFVFAILFSILTSVSLYSFFNLPLLYSILVGPAVFAIIFFGSFAMLSIKADKRAAEIEKILPSALQLMAANIRAGMTPDRAIWLSARDEFGAFKDEIRKVGSETVGGTPLEEAFMNMSKRIRSPIIERTTRLIVEGLESGGELAKLLTETSNEIQAVVLLRKEMRANVGTYAMFVVFASLAGAPMLLGISTFFVEMLTQISAAIGFGDIAGEAGSAGISMIGFQTSITPEFLIRFSIVVISVTSAFAALLIGLIKKGDEKRGIPFIPIFVLAALGVFFLVRMMITSMFGNVIVL